MLPALNEIFTQQSKPTSLIINNCNRLLYYIPSYPDTVIRFHVSDMILHVYTDAAYLLLPKTCSFISGHFYLIDNPPTNGTPNPKLNVPIFTIVQTLNHVVTSSSKSETRCIFINGQAMVPIRYTLITMRHPK